jgi:hypothetical protein
LTTKLVYISKFSCFSHIITILTPSVRAYQLILLLFLVQYTVFRSYVRSIWKIRISQIHSHNNIIIVSTTSVTHNNIIPLPQIGYDCSRGQWWNKLSISVGASLFCSRTRHKDSGVCSIPFKRPLFTRSLACSVPFYIPCLIASYTVNSFVFAQNHSIVLYVCVCCVSFVHLSVRHFDLLCVCVFCTSVRKFNARRL